MKINTLYLVIFGISLNFYSVFCLNIIPQLIKVKHTSAYNVSASETEQILVRTNADNLRTSLKYFEIRMNFYLKELNSEFGLTDKQFCFKRSLKSEEHCLIPTVSDKETWTFDRQNTQIQFLVVDNRRGFAVRLVILDPGPEKNSGQFGGEGFYYAKFENRRGRLISNYIQVFDYFFYYKKMISSEFPHASLLSRMVTFDVKGPKDLPAKFECSKTRPDNINKPDYFKNFNFFKWRQCTFQSNIMFKECINRLQDLSWPEDVYDVLSDGTLIIYKLPYESLGGIVCSDESKSDYSNAYYGGFDKTKYQINEEMTTVLMYPVKFNMSYTYESTKITAMDTLHRDIVFRKGQTDDKLFKNTLSAYYKANIDDVIATWTKDGQDINSLPIHIKQPNKFKLELPNTLLWEHAGIYKLKVQHKADASSAITFTFNVIIANPPEVDINTATWQKLKYMKVNDSLNMVCKFKNATSINLYMNGIQLKLEDETEIKKSYETVVQKYDYLANLNFSLSSLPVNARDGLAYNVNQIKFNNLKSEGQSHIISCEGLNNYGRLILDSSIIVLKPLNIIDAPSDSNCSINCMPNINHTFPCQLDTKYYEEKTSLVVEQFWVFDDVNLSDIPKDYDHKNYFYVDSEKKLTMTPVPSDAAIRSKLIDAKFECILRLTNGETGETVYDSTEDSVNRPRLTVSVKLQGKPSVLNIAWITPLVVVILLLLLIIILIIVIRRPKEEAYNVDKEERAQGNDPIQEMKDKETFKPYERPEEEAYHGRRASLGDESLDVGDDDMGELDEYDMDPSNFDEEGSFLGEYSDKPKKPAANNNVRKY